MKRYLAAATILAGLAFGGPALADGFGKPELAYSWTRLDWAFRNPAEAASYAVNEVYKKACLTGVKTDREGATYVSVPRWLDPRVPSTLNKLVERDGRTVLEPFPSWAANDLANPDALRSVLGFEIDSRNRMWVLDMGYTAADKEAPAGGQKLVVIDLDTGQELRRFALDGVADAKGSFLNDLAIDEVNEVAHLTDSGVRGGPDNPTGIIVYDYRANAARRVLHRDASTRNDPGRPLVVQGAPVFPGNPLQVGVNGVALSPDGRTLYWNLTTGDGVYAAPTAVLRDPAASAAAVSAAVRGPMRHGGGSDGMSVDDRGRLYVTNLALGRLELMDPATGATSTIAEGPGWNWLDTVGWDRQGRLLVSTNHLNQVFAGTARFDDPADPVFRIWRIQTDAHKGYAATPVSQ